MQPKRGISVMSLPVSKRTKNISSGIAHKGWHYYQGVIHDTYNVGHIEIDHHVIFLMPEDVSKHFLFPNFKAPVPGTLREVLDNDTTPRDKISLNGLGTKKRKSGGASMMMKT